MPSFIQRFQYQESAFLPLAGACAFQEDTFQNDAFQVCPRLYDFGSFATPSYAKIAKAAAVALIAASGLFAAPFTPTAEAITVDKWYRPLNEPVRTRPGLRAQLQQSSVGPVLNPDTQVTQGYESRWHQPWSESVRLKPGLRSSLQQTLGIGSVFPIEVIYEDKWHYAWSEPVRQKPGLRAHLQQALIAPVLDPNTQITQGYESRWHYPWSEPVRIKLGLRTGLQEDFFSPATVSETITPDKWIYPWTDPVRQKPGLRASLQQALIQPVLDPNSQITQGYESRWHYAWSEPVRQKPGIRASLQPTSAQTVLDPDTQITQGYESRWHYPWSEPVRFRRFITAAQQFLAFGIPSLETITPDKWIYPWSEPVRQKPGLRAALQQALIQTVLNPDTQIIQGYESRWHYAWSEPVRQRPGLRAFLQQAQPVPVLNPNNVIQGFESRWHQPWSEPVRVRRLAVAQYPAVAQTIFIRENITPDKWLYPWTEPVRSRLWLRAGLQSFIVRPIAPVVGITGVLAAIERGDLLFAGGRAFNQVGDALVGIQLDHAPRTALVGVQVDFVGRSALDSFYVAEDGATHYITEFGQSDYVPETITVDISSGSANVGAIVASAAGAFYVAEDGTTFYVTENGGAFYVVETGFPVLEAEPVPLVYSANVSIRTS